MTKLQSVTELSDGSLLVLWKDEEEYHHDIITTADSGCYDSFA